MKIIKKIDEILAAIILIAMTIIVFVNVISRYVLHASLSYTDELTTNFAVLLSMLGAAIAAKRFSHLGLSIVTDALSEKVKKVVLSIGYFLGAAFCLFAAYYGIDMVVHEFATQQMSPALHIPVWIYGSFLPLGCVLIAIQFVICMYMTIKKNADWREEA